MTFTLGRDLGIVMAKGVVLGVICSVTVLPAFVLIFDKAIHKFKHKTIIPEFKELSAIVTNHSGLIIAIFLILLIPALFGYKNTNVYYNLDESLPKDMDSVIATNKMKNDFSMMTSHFILVRDDIKPYKMKELVGELEGVDGITSVIAYDSLIGPSVPEDFIPDNIKDIFKQGGYNLILANSKYISRRIKKFWNLDSKVVYSPVNTKRFFPDSLFAKRNMV